MILSVPLSVRIRFPLSNFGFFFAEPDGSLALFGSRSDRRFCRTDARRLPIGGDVRRFPVIVRRSLRSDDDDDDDTGGGKNGA